LSVPVPESHPARRQRIQIRRFVTFAAVGSDAFVTHVVGHDQHNVWASSFICMHCKTADAKQREYKWSASIQCCPNEQAGREALETGAEHGTAF
jgi:hypothetical protein